MTLLGAPSLALATSGMSYTPPGGAMEMAETQEEGSDALNYFASGQHKKEEMAVQEELRESGEGVPASQLEVLPETVSIEGKTELKIQGGQIITGGTEAKYVPCNSDSPSTDECIQSRGADPVITRTQTTYEEPTTLDQQLIEKQATGETVPEPQLPESGDSIVNNPRVETAIDQNVENTSVVDKERGAKTNIISNTDTGVKLAE